MTKWYTSEPKVTPCIIQIQDHVENSNYIEQWDTYMLRTAVRKYHIGIGRDDLINDNPIINLYRLRRMEKYKMKMGHLVYPIIRINRHGFKAIKCPTISGTE